MNNFKELNEYCKKGQIVIVGSSFFSGMEITNRILTSTHIDSLVYDKSIEKLNVENALSFLNENVFPLEPSKVFVNIGDEDLKSAGFDLQQFISNYEWLLLNIHRSCKNCRIYITSIVSVSLATKKVNKELYNLALDTGCNYINFDCKKKDRNTYNKVFNILKQYFNNLPKDSNSTIPVVS